MFHVLEQDQLDRARIVLVRTRNPLNIGAAARAMSNFGFTHLRVVTPYDPSFQEAKSAVGAAEVLAHAEQYETIAEAISDCSLVVGTTSVGQRELQQPLHRLEAGTKLIRKHLPSGPVAILFGSEKIGLTKDDLSHCHWLLRIPTREQHHSMNLGQAVAICLYELVRNGTAKPSSNAKRASSQSIAKPTAPSADLQRLTNTLAEALQLSGYLKSNSPITQQKLRNLIRRLNLNQDDAQTLIGMLRQILWKLTAS